MSTSRVLVTRKRLLVILIILISLIILLMTRVGYWSIWKGDWLKAQAENQWTKDAVVEAKRGAILDRNMYVLAQSAAADTVVILPEKIAKAGNADAVADGLANALQMDRDEIYKKATDPEKKEIWIKRQISTEEEEAIKALNLTGVSFIDDTKRFYPNKDFASQVIGYTTLDGEGQTGIEKRYNSTLAGRSGRQVSETAKDGSGVPNGQEMLIQPQDGKSVVLTIDEIDQSFLETACKELYDAQQLDSVQGLVMDVTNGEIIAMANIPEFDLNSPPRDDSATLAALSTNNITAAAYEPGNIFSLFTAAAALDANIDPQDYTCDGSKDIDGEIISCTGTHGTLNPLQAAEQHCVVCSAQQADTLGKDLFYQYMKAFGFGEKTGIDFATDTAGDMLQKRYARNSDIAQMGAGQEIKTSQMQIASAAASIINGGTLYVPRLVLGLADANGNMTEEYEAQETGTTVSADTAAQLRGMMENVALTGEGSSAQVDGYTIGCFAGTAQQYEDNIAVEGKVVSTFIAYAPADNPKYMVMITANGASATENSAAVCAPYAKQVLSGVLMNGKIAPSGSAAGTEEKVSVPDVMGLPMQEAKDKLSDAGLQVSLDGSGTVQGQVPAAGEQVNKNSIVVLSMENKTKQQPAADKVTVPDLTGMDLISARNKALEAGLEFFALGEGTVQKQTPVANSTVEKGSSIIVEFKLPIASE